MPHEAEVRHSAILVPKHSSFSSSSHNRRGVGKSPPPHLKRCCNHSFSFPSGCNCIGQLSLRPATLHDNNSTVSSGNHHIRCTPRGATRRITCWCVLLPWNFQNQITVHGCAELLSTACRPLPQALPLDPQQARPSFTQPVARVTKFNPGAHRFRLCAACWYPVDTGLFVTSATDKTVKLWDTNR